jgi:fermentation-respiration switch protein FrsA (DUF1100 family)
VSALSHHRLARRVLGWLAILLMVYLVYAGILALLQRKLIFPGTALSADAAAGLERLDRVDGEQWWLEHEEGRVEAWFVPAPQASADKPGPAVILAHGNGELIDSWAPQIAGYKRMGVSVLMPEYRGYGRSQGAPSQEAIERDFVRFYDRLAARPEIDAERIAFHGFSLGGGVLAALARKRPPRAMILQSTFTCIADMVPGVPIPGFLLTDPFDTGEVVESLDVPMLVVHGRADRVIPFSHGQRLAELAADADFVDHPGDHHLMADQLAFWQAVRTLFERAKLL